MIGLQRLLQPASIGTMSPVGRLFVYGGLLSWTAIVLFPLYWIVITSVKLPIHVSDGPVFLPFIDFEPSGHAWHYIFDVVGGTALRPYVTSVVAATLSTGLAVLIGSMAAYALSRMAFRPSLGAVLLFVVLLAAGIAAAALLGVNPWIVAAAGLALFLLGARAVGRWLGVQLGNPDILFWIISQRILPPVVVAVPIYIMFQRAGLLDTRTALVVTYMTINLPIVVWLMYDFFAAVPRDLEESAAIDGASRFRIFFGIALPLARPGLIATTLLVFILAWNEYLFALFLSNAYAQTMPVLVAAQNATRGPQWWYMCTIIILMVLPVIALAVLLQRFIAKGLLLGAVKG